MDEIATKEAGEKALTGETNRPRPKDMMMLIFNYTNCIIGTGIISLPYAVSNSGLCTGMVLITVSAMFTAYTITQLVKEAERWDTFDYITLVKKALGTGPMHLIAFCHFLFPLLISMSYGVAITDNVESFCRYFLPGHPWIQTRVLILGVIYLFFLLPMCLLKSVSLLEKTSAMSIFCCCFYTGVLVLRSFTLSPKMILNDDLLALSKPTISKAFSSFYFSMTPHHNVFQLYMSLKHGTASRFACATHITVVISIVFYMLVSVFGYVAFGGVVQGNVFNCFCDNDVLANVARLVFAVSIILTYPLQILSSRQVALAYVSRRLQVKRLQECTVSAILLSSCISAAMVTKNFGLIVELSGALAAIPIAAIAPSCLYLKKSDKREVLKRSIAMGILLIGLLAIVAEVALVSVQAFSRESSQGKSFRYWCY